MYLVFKGFRGSGPPSTDQSFTTKRTILIEDVNPREKGKCVGSSSLVKISHFGRTHVFRTSITFWSFFSLASTFNHGFSMRRRVRSGKKHLFLWLFYSNLGLRSEVARYFRTGTKPIWQRSPVRTLLTASLNRGTTSVRTLLTTSLNRGATPTMGMDGKPAWGYAC